MTHSSPLPPLRLHLQRLANSLNVQAAHSADTGLSKPQYTEYQLSAWMSPSVAEALKRLCALETAGDTSDTSCEYLVVIHVVPCGEGVTTTVHASLLPVPSGMPPPVAVAVASQRRPEPFDAKSSAWVEQRQALSALCPSDCGEVITTMPVPLDGAADQASCAPLVEGLVNNLFVIGTRGSGGDAPCVVYTASVAEGALPGIIRIAVLAACRELGYRSVEAAPVPPPERADGEGEVWTEAFLCNAVRLIQPVRHMRWLPPCTRPGLDFTDAPGRCTREIAARVMRDMTAEASLSPPFT